MQKWGGQDKFLSALPRPRAGPFAIEELGLPETTVLRYRDGYYRLRYEAEPLLRGPQKPRLLIYLPLEYEAARSPLAELIAFGETLRPGEKGLANTRLGVIARRALKPFVPEAKLSTLDHEIEANNLTLAELENWAAGGVGAVLPTAVAVIYATQHVEDAALSFLSNPGLDAQLEEKNAASELADMVKSAYAAPIGSGLSLAEMRRTLARHILSTELLTALGDDTPTALKAIATLKEPLVAGRCADLARAWRNRMDLGSSYGSAAHEVEKSLVCRFSPTCNPLCSALPRIAPKTCLLSPA
jgi:hypothetical protein